MKIAYLVLAMTLISGVARAQALRLACGGNASRVVDDSQFIISTNNAGGQVQTFVPGDHVENSDEQIVVELTETGGRIRLPRVLVPLISGGGTGGWWNLTDVSKTDDEISARYALNVINHPALHIDRRTGLIGVDGRGRTFRGRCESVADLLRKF